MLFAAGFGTRMGELTRTRPKPLIPVAGQTLLDHALTLAAGAAIPRRVVNAHYLAEQVVAHLDGSDIPVALETPEILDTGGGLRAALPLLGPGAVFTLNTDAVWTGPNPLAALLAAWDDRMDALLMLVPLAHTHGRKGGGDFSLDQAGRLIRKGDLVYGGAQIIRTDRLAGIGDEVFSLNRLWDLMIAEGRAFGLIHGGEWCDVGRPDCIPLAEALLDG